MGMTVDHVVYLWGSSFAEIHQKVKSEWRITLPRGLGKLHNVELTFSPDEYGEVVTLKTSYQTRRPRKQYWVACASYQERLTGDSGDRRYLAAVLEYNAQLHWACEEAVEYAAGIRETPASVVPARPLLWQFDEVLEAPSRT